MKAVNSRVIVGRAEDLGDLVRDWFKENQNIQQIIHVAQSQSETAIGTKVTLTVFYHEH
jgi:hypothetical protein